MTKALFEVRKGMFGSALVLRDNWHPGIATFMEREAVRELILNYANGWSGSDIGFLSDLTWLTALTVLDRSISDLSPIQALMDLKGLHLETNSSTTLDYEGFSKLERLVLQWNVDAYSLFNCRDLWELVLFDFPDEGTSRFTALSKLRELALYGGRVANLEDLGRLPVLESLNLSNLRRLETLTGLEGLKRLTSLRVDRCSRLQNIEALRSLTGLKSLMLSDVGSLANLGPLETMPGLTEFFFTGKTKVQDGDLGVLFRLSELRSASFQDRRHYSHTREEVQASLKKRSEQG